MLLLSITGDDVSLVRLSPDDIWQQLYAQMSGKAIKHQETNKTTINMHKTRPEINNALENKSNAAMKALKIAIVLL